MNGGTLLSAMTGALANTIQVNDGASGTIVAANGHTLTISGGINVGANSTSLRFGEHGGTGVIDVTADGASFTDLPIFTFDVLGGTVRATGITVAFLTAAARATTIAPGARLEFLNPTFPAVRDLQSAGTVIVGAGIDLLIGDGRSTGPIAGAGGLRVASPSIPLFFGSNTGVLVLAGMNSYTGATTVESGATLRLLDSSIASSSGLTVAAGGLVGGTGTLRAR